MLSTLLQCWFGLTENIAYIFCCTCSKLPKIIINIAKNIDSIFQRKYVHFIKPSSNYSVPITQITIVSLSGPNPTTSELTLQRQRCSRLQYFYIREINFYSKKRYAIICVETFYYLVVATRDRRIGSKCQMQRKQFFTLAFKNRDI
jgi:hypothetical protein